MIRFLKIAIFSILFLFISNWLFGQASVVNNGNFPRHETLDQHTIEVRFNAAITGAATATDWTVRINGTTVLVNSATRINSFDVAIVFQASDVNPGQNFLLPGQTLDVRFINSSGSITTVTGGAPANGSGGFITSVNKVVATCSDVTFLQQGLITLPVAKTPDICSPVVEDFTQYQYYLSLRVRNSVDYNAGNLIHQINWGDGVTTNEVSYTSDASGVPSAAFYDQTAFGAGNPGVIMTSRPTHNYPSTLPLTGGDCSWNATVTPALNFAAFTACSGETKTTNFATYDTDNKNTGVLNLPPSPLATSNLVCRGTNVAMQFSDNTLLNCRSAVEPTVPNQRARAIRFTYGSTNYGSGNVPDIRITLPVAIYGAQPSIPITNNDATGTLIFPAGYYPTNLGPSDGNGIITLPASVTVATALTYAAQIFTVDPTKQVVGQRFYVKMEYWDVCNPYNPLVPATIGNAESVENYVEIITKPTAPIASNKEFCSGTALNPGTATCAASTTANQLISFELTTGSVTGSTAINWYFGNPTSGGVLLTNSYGTNCRFFRTGALASTGAQGTMRAAMIAGTPGVYSLWATYNITNGCTSDPVEVKLTVRPVLTAPAAPTGLTDICNGSSSTYTLASAPLDKTIPTGTITNTANVDFPTEYLWSGSAADVTFGTNPTIVDNINVTFSIATQPPTSTPRGVGAALQYRTATSNVTNNRCTTTPNNNLTVNVFGVTVGGTVSSDQSICNGSPFATLTLTGQRGNVIRWERTGPGGLAVIASTATTLTSATEPFPPNGPGTYSYYAVVRNGSTGPCSIVNSAAATITVNPIPPKPTITQGAGSAGLTICENGADQVILQSDNVGGIGVTYKWFKGATLVQNTTSNSITLDTNAESGSYTVQLVGPTPTFCQGPFSDPVAVAINPLPSATVTGGGSSCNGVAANDIVWTLVGTQPFNFTITASTAEPGFPIIVTGHTSNTYTIVAPNPAAATNYQMTALTDATTCPSASLGGIASVTPQAVLPPSVDSFIGDPNVCDDGASTNPPDAILDLNPNSVQNYAISYRLKRISTNAFLPGTISFIRNSTAAGVINIDPAYSDFGVVPSDPLGYQVVITAIQNVTTGCAGAVPILGPTLTINPRPATPTGPVNATACSSDLTGAPLSIADPGAGFEIEWSTAGPNLSAFVAAVPGSGTESGTNNTTFTPTSTVTATYYAFSRNTTTNCLSATGRAVLHTRDMLPTNINPDSDNNTANNRTCTSSFVLGASTPVNGTGTWTGPLGVTFTPSATSPTATANNLPLTGGIPTITQLTWTVRSTLNVCSPIVTTVDITRNPLPAAIDPFPVLCDPGSGSVSGVSLAPYLDAITGIPGSADRTIQWFTNSSRTIAVPDITNVTVTATPPTTFYNIVTTPSTGCTSNGQISFTLRPLPAAINHSAQICEDSPPGSLQATGIDLTLYESTITGGFANRDVEWYNDPGLAAANLIPAGNATGAEGNYSISADVTLYAKVIDITLPTPQCSKVATMGLDYQSRPNDNQIRDGNNAVLGASYTICASGSLILLQIDPSLNPGASYTWNVPTPVPATQFELLTGVNGFFIIMKFPNAIPSPGISISVTETLGTAACAGNTLTTSVIVEGSPPKPVITGPSTVCSEDNGVEFEVPLIGGSTYSWSLPPGATITSLPVTDHKITVQMSTFSGNVTVIQSSGNGCTSPAADPFPVAVVNRPTMLSANSNTLCSGQNVSAVHTLSSDIVGTTYDWQVVGVTGFVNGSILGDFANGVAGINQTLTNTSGVTASVTYRVTPIGPTSGSSPAVSCSGVPQNLTITVNPEPSLSLTNKVLCSNEAAGYEIKLAPSNLPSGTTFSWAAPVMSSGGPQGTSGSNVAMGVPGTIHINNNFVNNSTSSITATYTISAQSGLGCVSNQPVASRQFVITINPRPVGANDNTPLICSKANVNYDLQNNIATLGNNLVTGTTYSWLAASNGNVSGESLTSQPGSAITDVLRNITSSNQVVVYTVIPTSSGLCVGVPFTVSVTVQPEPKGYDDATPVSCSDATLAYDLSANIANTGSGGNNLVTGTTYSWEAAANPNITGESVAPQPRTTIDDVITNITSTDQVVVYTVIPTSSLGCVGSPFTISVTIRPEPKGFNDGIPIICSDATVNYNLESNILNVGLGGNGLITGTTYSWVATSNPNVSGESTTPQSGKIITDGLNNVTNADQQVVYDVTPLSANLCPGDVFQITVTVRPEPKGFDDNTPIICSDNSVNYSLTGNISNTLSGGNNLTTGTTFTWVATSNANVGGESTTSQSGNFITDNLNNVTNANQVVIYTVTPTNNLCVGNAFIVRVTVQPEPRGHDDNTVFVCSNNTLSYNLIANVSNTGLGGNNLVTGTTFSWIATSNVNVSGENTIAQASNVINDHLRNITNANQFVVYTVTPSNGLCVGNPFTITITVRPEPKGFDDNSPLACSNDLLNYNLAANVANTGAGGNNVIVGTTFSWVATDNANTTGESTTPQAGSVINNTIRNATNTNQLIDYTVTPTSGDGCIGDPFVISITIRPEPKGYNDTTPVTCSDVAFNYDLSSNIANTGLGGNNLVTGTTYSWIAANNASVSGESVTAQAGSTITDVLNNITNSNQIVVYTITPTSVAGCVGGSFTVSVTVNPEPKGYNDNSLFICSDAAVNYNLIANIANTGAGGNNLVTGTTFSWIAAGNANVGGESTVAQPGNTITDVLNNVTNSVQVVVYTVTPATAGCVGNPFTVSVNVRPEPQGFDDPTPVICSDAAVNYNLVTNISNIGNGGNNLVTGTTFSWIAASNPNVSGESNVSPGTSSTITDVLNNVTNGNEVVIYTVTPRSSDGCFGNTFTVSVTVHPEPKGFNDTAPFTCSDVGLNYDLTANIANTVAGGNNLVTGTTYSWVATPNANVGGESSGSTDHITDVLNNVTNINQIVVYTVTPTSVDGCVGNPFTVSVTVRPEPRGFSDNTPVICSDGTLNYDLAANIANTVSGGNNLVTGNTYSWIAVNNPNVTGESFVTPGTGSLINDLLNNVTNTNQVVTYTVTPTSGLGCEGNTFTVTVTVRPEPRGFDDSTPVICSDATVSYDLGLNIANLGAGGNNLVTGTTYSWIATNNVNVTGETTVTPGTSQVITDALNNVTNSNQIVIYTVTPTSTNGCAGNPFTVNVTVQPEPKGFNDNTPSICSDDQVNYLLNNNIANTASGGNNLVTGTTYSWVAAANANVTGESTTPQAGNTITDFLNNVTNVNQVVIYTVTPKSGNNCFGNPFTVSVTVRPEPKGFNDNTPLICSDAVVNYDLVTNISNTGAGGNALTTGTTYSWIATDNPNVTGESTLLPVTTSVITDGLHNESGSNQVVVYTVTPVNGTCTGNDFIISVTVRSEPVGADDNSPTVCSDEAISYNIQTRNINLLGNSVSSTFTYTVVSSDPGNVSVTGKNRTIASNASITDVYTNLTSSDVIITYTITPFSNPGNCSGSDFDVQFTIHPEPRGPNTAIQICSDDPINYNLQTVINTAVTGNSVPSKFKYSVTSSNASAVAPGPNRNTPSASVINDVYTNTSSADVTIIYTVTPYSLADDCEGTPFTLTITVHPEPVGQNVVDPVCSTNLNHNIQTSHITNSINSVFTYVVTSTDAIGVPPAADRTVASNSPITDSYTNTTGTDVIITYTITPFSVADNCEGSPFTYKVTISSKPVGLSAIKLPVCSDVPFSFDPQNDITNGVVSTFTWTAVYNGLTINGATPPAAGTGVISMALTNLGNANVDAVFTVLPKSGNCDGVPYTITVPIQPEPVVATNLNETKCSGDTYGKLLNTNGTSIGAATYDVTVVSKDAGLTSGRPLGLIGAGNSLANILLTDAYINITATPLKVVYSVVPHGTNGCTGDPKLIEFTINPDPVLLVPVPPDICSRAITNIVLGTNGTSINAQTYRLTQIEYSSNAGPFSTVAPADFTFPATNKLVASSGNIDHIKNDVFTNKSAFQVVVRYTIVPVSAGTPSTPLGCEGDPATVDIGVNPEPVLDPALTAFVCSGDKIDPLGTAFELKSQAGRVASAKFIIRSVSFPGMTAGGTNASTNVQLLKDDLDNDTYINVNTIPLPVTYTIAPISALGCIGDDVPVIITINPAPAIKAGLDRVVCSGSISGIVLQDNSPTSIAAASYNIISITSTGLTADPANATTGITTDVNRIRNDKFINLTSDRIVVTYLVEPVSAALCKGPQTAITLTVEPTILSTSINHAPAICSGTPVNIEFNSPTYSNGAPTNPLVTFSYKLQTPIPAGISGYTSGNSLNEGEAIEDILVNSTNSAITVHYQITPRAAAAANGTACQGTPEIIDVIVQPRPKINPVQDKTVCEGNPINLNLVSSTLPSSGVIKFLVTAVPENASITGFTASGTLLSPGILGDVLSNTDVEQRYVDYTFEPINVDASDATICANGIPITVRVTVNPRPDVTPSAVTLEICSSESIEVQLPTDTDPSSTIVKWTALASSVDVIGESAGAGDVLFQTLLNKSNVVQTVDYTITPSFNGCDGPSKHLIVTVNPIPTVALPNKITVCAGTPLNINLSPLANTTSNTTFRWEVTDINGIGTPGQFDGTGTLISQSFINNSDASATLLYQVTPIFHGNGTVQCEGIPRIINVSVSPTITAAFVSADEGVCEGTPVFLTFELHGQSPFDFVYSATDANGTVNKAVTKSGNVKVDKVTPTITTVYKIVSAKDALGCEVIFSPQPEITITVYQKITAAWTANVPPFVGGTSVVGFTNTSTPVDGSVFNYDWSFGTDGYVNPLTATGVGPFAVTYTRPGDHYVSLTASNKFAPVDLGCESTFAAKITIPVLPLMADFKFDPKAACFPQNIKITENTATGVAMDWVVKDSNGGIAATSNAPLPEFLITSPGKYTISLRTYDPFTHQEAFAPSAGKDFTIYDNPVASFDVRPTLVYVPDTELTTFNFSTGAPEYLWDFGDGSTSTEQEPKYTYKIEGIYDITLVAINDHGDGAVCRDTLNRKITAKQGGVTKVPNAFTPSPNGPSGGVAGNNTFNDVFLPIVKGAEEFNMQIFDRWGNLLFESNNSNMGWDGYNKNGHLMPAGVYVYKLTVRLSDGQRSTQIGDITMIR